MWHCNNDFSGHSVSQVYSMFYMPKLLSIYMQAGTGWPMTYLVALSCREKFAAMMGNDCGWLLPRETVALLVLFDIESNSSASSFEWVGSSIPKGNPACFHFHQPPISTLTPIFTRMHYYNGPIWTCAKTIFLYNIYIYNIIYPPTVKWHYYYSFLMICYHNYTIVQLISNRQTIIY